MTSYQERDRMYEDRMQEGYSAIEDLAKRSPYPSNGNGKQFVDFMVGRAWIDTVCKIRILVDFRGEYFSAFIIDGKSLPEYLTSPIRNRINFTAKEAYDFIIRKTKEFNSNGYEKV